MNQIMWNDRFNIGVDGIDKAHQRLFSIVGKLLSLNQDTAKQQHACQEGIKYLKSYTVKHFSEEEAYMRSINYEDYEIHKRLHDNMRDLTIPALEKELETEHYSTESVQHFLGLCIGWLDGHIMVEDQAIAGHTFKKWVHHPSENELESLEKAIIQTLEYLYRVKSQPVSVHYSGEDFASGNALCYRLLYVSPEKEYQQVYMLYESQMVLNILSERLGKPVKRIDKTVSFAIKALSEKFMDCVSRHFPFTEGYKLEKTDMMTFELLTKAFQKQYPPYSLLFNTEGNGYFALCVNPPKKQAAKATGQTPVHKPSAGQ